MSRPKRELQKKFKVFCEGDTEYNYIDEMRRQKKCEIALRPIDMKGGGYTNFLKYLREDNSSSNCLAKFILIDGDRAANVEGERDHLRELVEYCILQNQSERIPHIMVVNYPDFEYVACLHSKEYKGQDVSRYITKSLGYDDVEKFKSDKKIYNVLTTGGNSVENMLNALNNVPCFVDNQMIISKSRFEIIVKTSAYWERLERRGSNIRDFFVILNSFG